MSRPRLATAFRVTPLRSEHRQRPVASATGRATAPVPSKVLSAQLRAWEAVLPRLADEDLAGVHEPAPVDLVAPSFAEAPGLTVRQQEDPMPLRFGPQVSRFDWPEGAGGSGDHLGAIGRAAEEAGFSSLWVMDHFRQIPQVGRDWEPMLESYTTLGYLAAVTDSLRLGTLVTGITYRNVGHLGKIVATLDVLSGGRVTCGLGAAWFEKEHLAYGWEFPTVGDRYALLEDALQALPLIWGPGSPSFEGRVVTLPEAMCYPRPLQDPVPILVGGSGERRTLRRVARYADACNLFGEPDVVSHKVGVLHDHCRDADRDPAEIAVTQLSTAMVGRGSEELDRLVDELRPKGANAHSFRARTGAGTVDDQVGRYRAYAEAGVEEAIVSLADLAQPGAVERFAPVIAAFADG